MSHILSGTMIEPSIFTRERRRCPPPPAAPRRAGRPIACLAAALLAAACDPASLLVQHPLDGLRPVGLALSLSPDGGPSKSQTAAWRAADRVWVYLGNEQTVVLDTVVPFDPQADEIALRLQVMAPEDEELTLTVELRSGMGVLMRAVQPADLSQAMGVPLEVPVRSTSQSMAAGRSATCAVAANHRVYCWGRNQWGETGNPVNPWLGIATPVAIASGLSFRSVLLGSGTACALDLNGQAYCWGKNSRGQVGNGTTSTTWPFAVTSPVAVGGGHTFTTLTSGGGYDDLEGHVCGIVPDGAAYCWGDNRFGQLGGAVGASAGTPTPVATQVRFRAISAGSIFTCGLSTVGEAYCWGSNTQGQLGDGGQTSRATVVPVAGGHRFVAIAAGRSHACAISVDGALYCWGANWAGQLGHGTITDFETTPRRSPVSLTFQSVTAGDNYSCGVTSDSRGYCWGSAWQGALGSGSLENQSLPAEVAGDSRWISISAGMLHACGVELDGTARCWGETNDGARATGVVGYAADPVPVTGGGAFTRIASSSEHTCAIDNAGAAWCWGANYNGELGHGTQGPDANAASPIPVAGGLAFASIHTGYRNSCALTATGAAYCWGMAVDGSTGNAAVTGWAAPVPLAVDGGLQFTELAIGSGHVCGIATGGAAYCWGRNTAGQLGAGSAIDQARTPVPVAGGLTFRSIRAAAWYTCGITTTDQAFCWGENGTGQLGNGSTTGSNVPVPVAGLLAFSDLSLGAYGWSERGSNCGVTLAGDLYCWGDEWGCRLGNNRCEQEFEATPIQVGAGRQYRSAHMGGFGGCATGVDDQLYCWGVNYFGQTGVGHRGDLHGSLTSDSGLGQPTLVPTSGPYSMVAAGGDSSCAIGAGGAVCWGWRGVGQLGNGTVNYASTPEAILGGLTFD